MNAKVKAYFNEQYSKTGICVVPGHWPDFQTKQEVDRWLEIVQALAAHADNESQRI